MLESHLHTVLFGQDCPMCGASCGRDYVFCAECGEQLPNTDSRTVEFLNAHGWSVEEHRERYCNKNHPMDVEDALRFLANPPMLHCIACGGRLLTFPSYVTCSN